MSHIHVDGAYGRMRAYLGANRDIRRCYKYRVIASSLYRTQQHTQLVQTLIKKSKKLT